MMCVLSAECTSDDASLGDAMPCRCIASSGGSCEEGSFKEVARLEGGNALAVCVCHKQPPQYQYQQQQQQQQETLRRRLQQLQSQGVSQRNLQQQQQQLRSTAQLLRQTGERKQGVKEEGGEAVGEGEVTCSYTDIGTGHKPSECLTLQHKACMVLD
jgi:hypothetical protein